MKEHEHTANHGPAAKPVPGEVDKDAGSNPPAPPPPPLPKGEALRSGSWFSPIFFLGLEKIIQLKGGVSPSGGGGKGAGGGGGLTPGDTDEERVTVTVAR